VVDLAVGTTVAYVDGCMLLFVGTTVACVDSCILLFVGNTVVYVDGRMEEILVSTAEDDIITYGK